MPNAEYEISDCCGNHNHVLFYCLCLDLLCMLDYSNYMGILSIDFVPCVAYNVHPFSYLFLGLDFHLGLSWNVSTTTTAFTAFEWPSISLFLTLFIILCNCMVSKKLFILHKLNDLYRSCILDKDICP